jgi:hypothetical protein
MKALIGASGDSLRSIEYHAVGLVKLGALEVVDDEQSLAAAAGRHYQVSRIS